MTEREIIDTAMGNVDVGPKIYQFLPTGKIEQFRDLYLSKFHDLFSNGP